jgi:AsmA protein
LRKLLLSISIILIFLLIAALAAPFVIPTSTYESRLIDAVHRATGRELSIKGGVSLSLFPHLELRARDAALANAPDGKAPALATIDDLRVRLAVLPLLSGTVAIDEFVLVNPAIHLEIDRNGRPNWQFAGPADAAAPAHRGAGSGAATPDTGRGAPPETGGGAPVRDLRFGDIRLTGGTVTFDDARTGRTQRVEKLDLTVSLPTLDAALHIAGSAAWNGRTIRVDLDADEPRKLAGGEESPVGLRAAASDVLDLSFKGTARLGAALGIDGDINLSSPSLRDLVAWTGAAGPLPAGNGFGPLSIAGHLGYDGTRAAFHEARIALDAIKASGELAVATGGPRPALSGRLAVERLDLNPYLPPQEKQPATAGKAGAAATAPSSPQSPAQPPVQPPAGSGAAPPAEGWSDAPLDLSGLRAADADLALSADSIAVRRLEIGKSQLSLTLHDGQFAADLAELALYDGRSRGRLTLDGRQDGGNAPSLTADIDLAGVQIEPLLHAVADFDRLRGAASLKVSTATRGQSERQMVEHLDGTGSAAIGEGALKGIDLGALARDVTAVLGRGGGGAGQGGQTEFSSLTASWTIADGVLHNQDLLLKAPLLEATGAGTVELPPRTLHYRLEPHVAAGRAGGIAVPILVQGPWNNLGFAPDVGALARQPAIEKLLGKGSGSQGDAAAPADAQQKPLEDLLKGLLRGKR